MSNINPGDQNLKKTARELLSRTSAKEIAARSKQFLAPYSEDSKTAIVQIDGVNYRFKIIGFQGSGFGIFQPLDPLVATFVKTAEADLVANYLHLLPRMHFILVCETDIGWCGYPYNIESAQKKGIEREVIIRNISDVQKFDVITARFDGSCFWFEELFVGSDPVKAEQLRECFALRHSQFAGKTQKAFDAIKNVTPEEEKTFKLAMSSWKIFQKENTENTVQEFLDRGGAKLDNYVIRGQQIEIVWRAQSGAYYKSRVDKDTLDVVSAGICLEGEDNKFHLKDLPGIIQEGEEKNLIYVTNNTIQNIDVDE